MGYPVRFTIAAGLPRSHAPACARLRRGPPATVLGAGAGRRRGRAGGPGRAGPGPGGCGSTGARYQLSSLLSFSASLFLPPPPPPPGLAGPLPAPPRGLCLREATVSPRQPETRRVPPGEPRLRAAVGGGRAGRDLLPGKGRCEGHGAFSSAERGPRPVLHGRSFVFIVVVSTRRLLRRISTA